MTDAELYRRSSQYRKWSFTRQEFAAKLKEPNARIRRAEHSLSAEEEHQLVLFYAAQQTKSLCQQFKLPSQVRATAISFFRKFYLAYSVMEYHPKLVLPTCVFLASKAENCYVSINTFCESLAKTEPQQILDLEFLLFKALGFTLTVHNALRPLHGFFLDMQTQMHTMTPELCAIHDKAKAIIVDAFASDACFLYTPTQIALAAMMQANELVITEYMVHAMDGPNTSLDRLLEIVQECRKELQVTLPEQDAVKAVSKKLHLYYKSLESEGPDPKRRRVD